MNTFIVNVKTPAVRKKLEKLGTVGKPTSLHTILIVKTEADKEAIAKIAGVISVEEETFHEPSELSVQKNPANWFLPAASYTMPDYYYNKTGEGVVIYVMDSGVRLDHEDFLGRDAKVIYSFDENEYGGGVRSEEHGTMCTSCAAGNKYGIAKGAIIRHARYNWSSVDGVKALDTILADYLSHDMPAVLSMSFGATEGAYDAIYDAMSAAGLVLVAAAGNNNQPHPAFPAIRNDIIAVGAHDDKFRPSVWSILQSSNYGPELDIWAGGTDGTAASIKSPVATARAAGTSSACPLVAGAVALLLQGSKKLTSFAEVMDVKQRLIDGTRKGFIEYGLGGKYDDTPNRALYTLSDVKNPPEPVIVEKPKRKFPYAVVAAVIVVAVILGMFI